MTKPPKKVYRPPANHPWKHGSYKTPMQHVAENRNVPPGANPLIKHRK
jgi:hypothetical protein